MAKAAKGAATARALMDQVVSDAAGEGDDGPATQPGRPHPTDPAWTGWVLAQLHESEVWETDDGRRLPYAKGLRRFARTHLVIDESTSDVRGLLNTGDGPTVAVVHTIVLAERVAGLPLRASGVACRGPFNLDDRMQSYPAEVADTVAEARALTRLLGLSVVTKDEIKGSPLPATLQQGATISAAQAKQLEKLLKVANLGVPGFLAAGKKSLGRLEDMPTERFFLVCKYLDGYARRLAAGEQTDDDERVRRESGPYDAAWRG